VTYRRLTRDQHFTEPGAKRILALDGGGLRGIMTLGILRHIEAVLAERHAGLRSIAQTIERSQRACGLRVATP
jgi:hypothetical protein